ncbi:MAG: GTPase Era [Mycoplasmataceae bacterium]|nr:GTPase Era [Mycoplasmataceae bacterium]
MKVCWVAIIGRPNVGKSTLINKIIKYDLSIISNKAQTTREQILGIYNENDYQLIFLDTPGIHKPQSIFGDYLNKKALDTLKESDLILFLQPIDQKISNGDLFILEKIKNIENKIALITKKDLIKSNFEIDQKIKELEKFDFKYILVISQYDEKSIDSVVEKIKEFSYEDDKLYDDDFITDRSELFISKEIIRFAAIENLNDELPHSISVEIIKYDINPEETFRDIEAIIYCKKESQKGIIIGKNGSMIKKIGTRARKIISEKFNSKVHLVLSVKVNKDWINNEKQIKKLGY